MHTTTPFMNASLFAASTNLAQILEDAFSDEISQEKTLRAQCEGGCAKIFSASCIDTCARRLSPSQLPASASMALCLSNLQGQLHPEFMEAHKEMQQRLPRTIVVMNKPKKVIAAGSKRDRNAPRSKIRGYFELVVDPCDLDSNKNYTERQIKIVKLLRQRERAWTIEMISSETGWHISKLTNSLKKLQNEGVIRLAPETRP